MSEEGLPWPEKHRPQSLDQVAGNHEALQELSEWVASWKRKTPKIKAMLLLGPPGIGKTSAVVALSRDLDAELVEFNASDKRNKGAIETQVWTASTQQTLDGRMRIILLDEVDGLSGTGDRGGAGAILKVIEETVHPLIMTANDPESPRLKDLVRHCRVLNMKPIEAKDVLSVLKRVAMLNGFEIADTVLEDIAELSGGDLRAAISDLEVLAVGDATLGVSALASRDVRRGVKETLSRLFMATSPIVARRTVSEADVDPEEMVLWLEENLHLHLTAYHELSQGFEALSLSDLALGRIRREQNWKLLAYVQDFLAVGIVASRSDTPYRRLDYSEPSWPLLVWRGARRWDKTADAVSRISDLSRVSRRRAGRAFYDTLEQIATRDPKSGNLLAKWLGVSRASIASKESPHSRQTRS